MGKDISFGKLKYSNVGGIEVPKADGGTAVFRDVSGSRTITENGTYDVSKLEEVVIDIPETDVEPLSVTENGEYTAAEGSAYSPVTVDVEAPQIDISPLSVTENGIYTPPSGSAYGYVTVDVPTGGGGGGVDPSDVNFIDYDGMIVYSYKAADFATLDAMPANPSHDGLTAQGWNWTLAKAKAYVAKYGKLWIGQMYVTTSGDTEIDIVLEEGRTSPYLGIAVNGEVSIDWGDGSTPDTVTGTSLTTQKTKQHVYAAPGAYTMTISVVSGKFAFYKSSSSTTKYLLSKNSSTANENRAYADAVRAVRLGNNAHLGQYALQYCTSLESITIPNGATSIENYTFNACFALKSITIPDSVTSIGVYALSSCFALKRVSIPDGVTDIGGNAFSINRALESITIPDGVTDIGESAFADNKIKRIVFTEDVASIAKAVLSSCFLVKEVIFASDTPPTVANSNAFSNLPTDCIIYVPQESLSDYTSATNYPSSSTYTYIGY